MSETLTLHAGPFQFTVALEHEKAPQTCAAFLQNLPFTGHLLHSRWSGEAMWVPLDTLDLGVPIENSISHALPGQILFYPGGVSETEILFPYGASHFGSIAGHLAGNHFLTVVDGTENLRELGRLTLWEGAQDLRFVA